MNRARTLAGVVTAALLLAGCGTGSMEAGATADAEGGTPRETSHDPTQASSPKARDSRTAVSTHSAGAQAPTTEETTRPARTPSGPARCHTGQLSARITDIEVGAGNRYAVLVFTNNSDRPCTLNGHPGMRLLNEDREPQPTDVRKRPPQPHRVLIRPGQHASASLQWGVVPGEKPPVRARHVRVWPPDTYRQLTLPFETRVSDGVIYVTSVVSGDDGAGRSPS